MLGESRQPSQRLDIATVDQAFADRIAQQPGRPAGRRLDDRHVRPSGHGLQGDLDPCFPDRPSASGHQQPGTRLHLDHLGLVADHDWPRTDRVIQPTARRWPSGVYRPYMLGADYPLGIGPPVGKYPIHRRGARSNLPCHRRHDLALTPPDSFPPSIVLGGADGIQPRSEARTTMLSR